MVCKCPTVKRNCLDGFDMNVLKKYKGTAVGSFAQEQYSSMQKRGSAVLHTDVEIHTSFRTVLCYHCTAVLLALHHSDCVSADQAFIILTVSVQIRLSSF